MKIFTRKPLLGFYSLAAIGILPLLATIMTPTANDLGASAPIPTELSAPMVERVPEFSLDAISDDVLWLARCIYSETKRADEQELVAWVVRNRVDTRYRGQDTYREVVLDPYQFSAFNATSGKRRFYASLTPQSRWRGWQNALRIAHETYWADEAERPFSKRTRHFYSERSMKDFAKPYWVEGYSPIELPNHNIDPWRFRFYKNVR
ncbi:MAG: cell wall hydrolase [Bacteroidota bacterium]